MTILLAIFHFGIIKYTFFSRWQSPSSSASEMVALSLSLSFWFESYIKLCRIFYLIASNTTQLIRFPEDICDTCIYDGNLMATLGEFNINTAIADDIIMWNKFHEIRPIADKVQNEEQTTGWAKWNLNPFLKYITVWAAWRPCTRIFWSTVRFVVKNVIFNQWLKNKQSHRIASNRTGKTNISVRKLMKPKWCVRLAIKNCSHSSFNQKLSLFFFIDFTQSHNHPIISEQSWFINAFSLKNHFVNSQKKKKMFKIKFSIFRPIGQISLIS